MSNFLLPHWPTLYPPLIKTCCCQWEGGNHIRTIPNSFVATIWPLVNFLKITITASAGSRWGGHSPGSKMASPTQFGKLHSLASHSSCHIILSFSHLYATCSTLWDCTSVWAWTEMNWKSSVPKWHSTNQVRYDTFFFNPLSKNGPI